MEQWSIEIKQHLTWFSKCQYQRMDVDGCVLVRSGQTAKFWQFHPLYFLGQVSYLKKGLTD